MSSFETEILNPDVTVHFALEIQGIPQLLLSGPVPVGPGGTAWSVPTSSGYNYVWVPNALDASDIRDSGTRVDRATAEVSPGAMTFRLVDDRAATLLDLFAWDKQDGIASNLTADVPHDTGSTGSVVLSIDDASSWTVGDLLWLGRECMAVDSKTSTTLTCDRDLFSIGNEDTTYRHNAEIPVAPGYITSWPRTWVGRYVRLYAWLADTATGRALDTSWDGTYARELWRGVIRDVPRPDRSWGAWTIQADDIVALLRTEVGGEFVTGSLMRVPGGLDKQLAGSSWANVGTLSAYVGPGSNKVHITVRRWSGTSPSGAPAAIFDYSGANALTLSSGSYTWNGITTTWIDDISATLNTAIGNSFECNIHAPSGVTIVGFYGSASYYWEAEINWDAQDSCGRVLGFQGTTKVAGVGYKIGEVAQNYERAAVYISETASAIPFYFNATAGKSETTAPPAPGYAIIGDPADGAEVVYYESIFTESGGAEKGLSRLDGVQRGLLGTQAKTHVIPATSVTSAPETPPVRFGVAIETVTGAIPSWSTRESSTAVEGLVKLAVSTSGNHHGPYDAITGLAGGRLNPLHFDVTQMLEVEGGYPADLRRIRFLLAKSEKLSGLWADILAPLGLYPVGRWSNDGTYRVGLVEVLPALESESVAAVGTADLSMTEPASADAATTQIVTEIRVEYLWDAVAQEPVEGAVATIMNRDAEASSPVRNALEWRLVGRAWNDPVAVLTDWAQAVFQRFGAPYDILTLTMGRRGWLLRPGMTLSLTLPGYPSPQGERGLVSKLARVLLVSPRYSGREPGALVTVVVERQARHSTYVPSLHVTAYSGTTVTVSQNYYTDVGNDTDHFDIGDVVWCYEALGGNRLQRTITGKTATTIEIDSSTGYTATAMSTITGGDYDQVQASQRQHVHLSDGSPPALSVSDTTTFRYT